MILYGIDNIRDLFGHKVGDPHCCCWCAQWCHGELSGGSVGCAGEPVHGEEEPHLPAEPVRHQAGAGDDAFEQFHVKLHDLFSALILAHSHRARTTLTRPLAWLLFPKLYSMQAWTVFTSFLVLLSACYAPRGGFMMMCLMDSGSGKCLI